MAFYWAYKPHLRAGLMPSSKWPTQKELSGVSVDIFCFVCAFLNLIRLLLVYYCFQFCVFMDVCVSVCAHARLCISCTFFFLNSGLFVFYLLTCLLKKEKEGIEWNGWEGGRTRKGWRRETDQNILCGKSILSKTAAAESWTDDFKKEEENLVKFWMPISPNPPKKPGHTLGQFYLLPENLRINSAQQKEELTNKIRTILDGTVGSSAYLQI